ncbi:MAG: hypothetical protein CGU28_16540 [Candidatus Dactylopiibacterium carminicum]|uniref:Uncharacterized protein n=1 Tax=Candidatus Dactylopiibacterium carminicum TaxID=857335 RepID=A0A272EMN6_9RHOO|nr:hypothetical protein [Candidatus Dactylopiibacterium carminicum]KAF7597802.1 hypothetical protein BGI27_16800 [Candidatus Dactylopiibacterium carminicum]PAS91388.1 MAG: hypothetical protein CGU29_16700 [Candidatus Dactylopiibacterium carminicum]PAS92491.1 MAG: hypothetical protein CGU28_16540 [Candidatus Dactylopiibacterium carminicum]PAS95596.1 MAG: hypothetical protein BSR46_16830 [Candidatus Dactylopiibacterium carminicum]
MAARRLKASPEQIQQLFSGRAAVLKKGIGQELSERYIRELGRIGMIVHMQPMPAMEAVVIQPPENPLGVESVGETDDFPGLPPIPGGFQTQSMEKTEIASADIVARCLRDDPLPAPAEPELQPEPPRQIFPEQREALSWATAPGVERSQFPQPEPQPSPLPVAPESLPEKEDQQLVRPRRSLLIYQAAKPEISLPAGQEVSMMAAPAVPGQHRHLRILLLLLLGVALAGIFVLLNG